ncbi:FecCD family ABC transporter permease [Allonocardiopsis opalescens]|uniref:Iron complex transport system permease protein n=1 Tax=Allonocardiopsis opalescens TaxID=1144618 RepID=A0A2T0QE07_9ACTN|nr:iron ABC transporter permease [Allonocardiopsis opalescens]PRY02145.1 iron complex transport system permease protein [Allonocardiopsis opalescens]
MRDGPAWRLPLLFGSVSVAVVAVFLAALCLGSTPLPVDQAVRALFGLPVAEPRAEAVMWSVRLPRALTAVLAGAALGMAGLQMQTLFRNPLAEPYILGVSAGASLGVALVVTGAGGVAVGGFTAGLAGLGRTGIVVAASLGAALVLAIVLVLSRWVRSVVTLLVIGVMVGSGVTSVISVLLVYTNPQAAQQFINWGLGTFAATTWLDLRLFAPVALAALLLALAGVKSLNALLLGENYARTMGVRVRRTRMLTMASAALLAGSVTAFCGPVAFLGLAVPHLARIASGTADHRVLAPATVLLGAAAALLCGIAAQAPETGILPLNAVTALLGAPIVIVVLVRSRGALRGAAL